MNRERLLSNKYNRGWVLKSLFYCGWDHTPQIGVSVGIENFARNQAKNLHRRGSQAQGLLEVKGELEAQDKGGPRSQETKT